jgi:hypothetical protein
MEIIKWINYIFGVNQLVQEKKRVDFVNTFSKESYEQKMNLRVKLNNLKLKNKPIEYKIKKLSNKIFLMLSFGQTPYKLFNSIHPTFGINYNKKDSEEGDEFLSIIKPDMKVTIKNRPICLEINYDFGIIFLIDEKHNLEIIKTNFFSRKYEKECITENIGNLNLSNFIFPKINIIEKNKKDILTTNEYNYYLIRPEYCISSFYEHSYYNKTDVDDIQNNDDFTSFYNLYLNKLSLKKDIKQEKSNNKNREYIRYITCRHLDNTFKVYNIPVNKSSIKKDYFPISIFCEDFVTSCCVISHNQFLIGLNNGKLLKWSIKEQLMDESNKNNVPNNKIKIKFINQIQAHKGSINFIDINLRLGIIITSGMDNYIFIRKIYDLELINAIYLKPKYLISMAKVSPMNFLYIMCYNKVKKKVVIFGYTLTGLRFAKTSKEDSLFYETIDFTKSGNLVLWDTKGEIIVLFGNNLKQKDTSYNEEFNKIKDKIKKSYIVKYVNFNGAIENSSNKKVLLNIFNHNGKKKVESIDVCKYPFFD